ncbi:MAG: hypothetical protein ACTSPB_07435 [Candidatus Thorarchaeota archaeon]
MEENPPPWADYMYGDIDRDFVGYKMADTLKEAWEKIEKQLPNRALNRFKKILWYTKQRKRYKPKHILHLQMRIDDNNTLNVRIKSVKDVDVVTFTDYLDRLIANALWSNRSTIDVGSEVGSGYVEYTFFSAGDFEVQLSPDFFLKYLSRNTKDVFSDLVREVQVPLGVVVALSLFAEEYFASLFLIAANDEKWIWDSRWGEVKAVKYKDVIFAEESEFQDIVDDIKSGIFLNRKKPPTRRKKIESKEIPAGSPSRKLPELFSAFTEHLRFSSEMDAQVYVASLLVKDNKISLKGVPGTGKTTIVNSTILLFCAPENYDWTNKTWADFYSFVRRSGYNWDYKSGKRGDVSSPLFGVTKHNPDKTPDDILYYTDIMLEEWKKNIEENPPEDFKKTKESVYNFTPKPRPVAIAPIKLHNEANRMNKSVQDAILGLMEEKEVEFLGESLFSPSGLTFLDYNPHLDWEREQLDAAFLDRIDVSLYFSASSFRTNYDIALASTLRGKRVEETLVEKIQDGLVPLTFEELRQIWEEVVELVQVPREVLLYAIAVLGMFKSPYRVYGETYSRVEPYAMKGQPAWVDLSMLSYIEGREQKSVVSTTLGEGPIPYMNSIKRPLGYRALRSILNNLRAYVYLQNVLGIRDDLVVDFDDVDAYLSYVIEHRVNLGVDRLISTSFLNFKDFIDAFFKQKVLSQLRSRIITIVSKYAELEERLEAGTITKSEFKKQLKTVIGEVSEEPVIWRLNELAEDL